MLRWVVVVLVLALGAWAWLLLRSPIPAAPARALVVEPESDPESPPAVAELRGGAREVPARTSVDGHEDVGNAAAATPAETATGVLAGRLLLDGGPLPDAATLTLASDAKPRGAPASEVTLVTDALGRFRREGLPADWSGRLVLWLPYRLPGDGVRGTSAVRVDAPSESLAIDVVRVPCLRGRLTHARPELAGELNLDVRLYSADGGYAQLHRQTDAEGRFLVALDELDFPKVRVEATARDGATCSVLRERDALSHDPLTGDFDVGDLPLSGGFEAHVRVLDPDRAPVEGAQVFLRGASLRVPAKTDAAGETRFPVPDTATSMRVAASGFALESFPPPRGSARTDVLLRRTNRLRVTVLDARGVPWSNGRLRLRSEGALYASGDATATSAHVRGGRVFDGRGNVDELGPYQLFATQDDGSIELQDLSADVALDVEAVDPLGGTWVAARVAGLGPEESRSVELRLPEPGPRVRGRCTDRAGAAVGASQVFLERERASVAVPCASDGSFEAPPLAAGEARVYATAPGYARTEPMLVDAARGELLLVLERGRQVQVELRDGRGQEIADGELRLRVPGTQQFWSGSSVGSLHTFRDVPVAPLAAEFEWFSRRITADVGAEQERVTLTVEALGRLDVAVDASVPEPEEWLNLRLTALDGPEAGAELVTNAPSHTATDPAQRTRSLDLWPGRYEVQLLEFRMDERRRPLPSVPYLNPVQVEIAAGETARVTLGARD